MAEIPTQGKWIVSTDPECWYPLYEWDTEEEAIEGAAAELGLGPGDTFYVGKVNLLPVEAMTFFDAAVLIDMARERLDERVGEDAGEQFLEKATVDMENDLQAKFNDVFQKWMKEHGLKPRFFDVESRAEPVVVPEEEVEESDTDVEVRRDD